VLHEVTRVDPSLLEQLEELENELFENSLNGTTLGNEMRSGARLWVAGAHCIEGYMLLRVAGGLCDILRLGVRPAYQSHGIGYALLKEAMVTFPDLMLSVKKSNLGAVKLYKRHGFHIVGDLGESWAMRTTSSAS